jgi:ubiquinone/menaquinone biosynthesis C-methylase UbiE
MSIKEKAVIECYENYREEYRLTTNQARKIEFITTVRVLQDIMPPSGKVLDCAAGTGVYAFHLADKGYEVTATDITPRHVDIMNEICKEKGYSVKTAVVDASDLSMFDDESYDVVLNMGPYYHLTGENDRKRNLSECKRVLKKNGILITAYIPRYYVYQLIAMSDPKFLVAGFEEQIRKTGVLHNDDELCFWTDTYYSTAEEMEQIYEENDLSIIDHFAQDGMAPMFADKVDTWPKEKFELWCEHHYQTCRQKSLLGMSNHVLIAGKKC